MPQAIVQVLVIAGTLKGTAATIATIAAAVVEIAAVSAYQKKKAKEAEEKLRSRVDVMIRSATEPARIIYGERRVSGPLAFANVRLSTGTADNSDLWQVVALAGHEVNAITDLYLDGDKIPAASINGSGEVTSGKYGPVSGRTAVQILKNLGTDSQSALSLGFNDWTTNHRLRGVAHIATRFELSNRGSAGLWKNGAPSDVRVVVQGKKVYDPRLDSTAGGSGSHRVTDPSTWEYSANPALCLADYLIDSRLGMGQEGITYDDIDYEMVATAADQCDASVSIPGGGTEPRYEINGVLFSTDSYETNIRAILKCMNGSMVWSNGQFRIRAGEYEAPVESFDEADIVGTVAISTEFGRDQRFNKIRGTYQNAGEDYDLTQHIPVTDANLIANRDNGVELVETIDQPLVTSEYQAQRLAFKLIQINNQQLRATIPLNYRAMNVRVGDRIQVSVDALNWSNKIFRVEGWKFGVEDGFVLSVIEDSSTAYDDPDVADYSTRSATGTITFADPTVPSPSGLTATAERNGILVQWDEPEPPVLYDEVQVFASPDSSWSNAVLVASTRGTTFFHDLDPGTQRYYWARSIDNKDDLSDRDPDSDTSSVVATAGAVGVGDVDGAGALASEDTADFATQVSGAEKPENNADVTSRRISTALVNADFEAGAEGWTLGSGWSIVEEPANARRGDFCLSASNVSVAGARNNTFLQIEPGDRVLAQGFAFRSAGTGGLRVRLEWRDASGASVSSVNGNTITAASYEQSRVVAVAPAGASFAAFAFVDDFTGPVSGRCDGAFMAIIPKDVDIDALELTNAPAEAGADQTANNGQPPSWLTALIAGSDINSASVEAVLDALNLINAAAEAGADVTSNNGQPPSWLTALIAGSDINSASVESVLDALNLINAAAEAGADVTSNNGQPPSWLTALIASSDINSASVEAALDALNLINAAAEAGADVTGDHAADINVLDTQNAPADAAASRGLIAVTSSNTDAQNAFTSTSFTTAQTASVTLSETTTVCVTVTAMLAAQSLADGDYICGVRVMRDTTELGALSGPDFSIRGIAAIHPFVYRRVETLSAGTYVYDFDVQKRGSVNVLVRARVITIEELR